MKTCTYDALKTVCEIIRKVVGNPKMKALGDAMTKSLEAGKCHACVFACVCVCVLVYTHTHNTVQSSHKMMCTCMQ